MKFSYSLIKKLSPAAPAKTKLAEALNSYSFETEDLGGDTFDISLASNRYSDAASHLGIAREAAAMFGGKLKNPAQRIVNPPSNLGFLKVEVKDGKLCPRYAARYFEIRKVSASPLWMQKILKACGLKPINNVVDLMNYVMLEVGQPLHSFDYDKIKGVKIKNQKSKIKINESKTIFVRKAKSGEKIETLDGQHFILNEKNLVIADSEKAVAIAGVKGGANSGVDKNTKRIIVEAANFDPVSVFKTSREFKLNTDASIRFSHGLSPALVDWGMDRATELLIKMGAKLVDSVDVYPNDVYPKPVGEELIQFDFSRYENLIGAPVDRAQVKKWFSSLGFSISEKKEKADSLMVKVPAWRTDIERFEDLAEEISRLAGHNKLKPQAPAVSLKPAYEEDSIILKDKIRRALAGFGLDEVYNYSFTDESSAKSVEIENPISKDFRFLRTGPRGALVKNILDNGRFFPEVRIFEVGNVFEKRGESVFESLHLGVALGAKKGPLILELKGMFDELLKGLGLVDFFMTESKNGESLGIEVDRKILGNLNVVHLEKGWTAAIGEINLDALLPLLEEKLEFKPLSKYPAVMRDISILVGEETRIGNILDSIQKANPELIENVDLIDEYEDEKLNGKQSMTFRIVFQAENRTLTDEEVNKETEKIVKILKEKFKAEVR